MGRTLPILTLVSLLVGLLAVVVLTLSGPGLFLLVPLAVAIAIMMIMQKTQIMYVGGGVALLCAVIGILGMIENVGTEDGTLDLGITSEVGQAVLIVSFLVASAALLATQWGDIEPVWMQYLGAAGIVAAIGLVIFTADNLGNISYSINFLTGLFVVLAALPAFTAFRDAES